MGALTGRTYINSHNPFHSKVVNTYDPGTVTGTAGCDTLLNTEVTTPAISEQRGMRTNEENKKMSVRLGDIAPDFTQESTAGSIRFHDWAGDNWVVLFSHPKDFTPVCTTELGALSRLKSEFDRRNVKVIGLSVDGVYDHESWSRDIEETQGAALNFPLLADTDRKVSTLYGMIHPNADSTMTVRSVFVIGPDKRVKLMLTYPASTGRNFAELLRTIDSLQLTCNYKVATPANWKQGDDCIILPAVTNAEAETRFPKGYRLIKHYLRTTPQPNL